MTSLICVLCLLLVTPPSLCWPQDNEEDSTASPVLLELSTAIPALIELSTASPVLIERSTTPPYEFDYSGGEIVDYVTTKGSVYDDYGGYDDYGYYDDYSSKEEYEYGHYGDYFAYGDRNNPADTGLAVSEMHGMMPPPCQMPWVYIIVPVVQVDVFYLDSKDHDLEDINLNFPIETYFFEFGDFGMGHLNMGTQGQDSGGEGADEGDSSEEYYTQTDLPLYELEAEHYDTAGELDDANVMEYPGIDHGNYWVDWIFMVPPGQIIR